MRLSILVAILTSFAFPLPTIAHQDPLAAIQPATTQPAPMECSAEHLMEMVDLMSELQRDLQTMNEMLEQMRGRVLRGASRDTVPPVSGMEHLMPTGPVSDVMPMGDTMTGRMDVLGAMMSQTQHRMSVIASIHAMLGCPLML
jgi:hypothetical protein